MPHTYTQLPIQIVFAVKHRRNLIQEQYREAIERYICSIVKENECKPLAIYCNPDHLHLLLELNPKIAIADLVRIVKCNSSKWFNQEYAAAERFRWQAGYGAFCYSPSQVPRVMDYIYNQPYHHKNRTFEAEYKHLLNQRKIDHLEEYLFDFYH